MALLDLINQRYDGLEPIGQSALFAVSKARDRNGGREVAVKIVQPALAVDPIFVAGLKDGLARASSLRHPNIAQALEFASDTDGACGVFEFVRGIDLKERIRRIAPFSISVAVDFACSIAEALACAHTAGQPHGDLRPENIIVTAEGIVKVTDFGVQPAVRLCQAAQREVLKRAAPYHAPELSMAQEGTPAGDVYAFGALIHEMLTGSAPYTGATLEALADQHALAAIPSARTRNAGVPRALEGILVKCLQKRPDRRYASALELLADLKSVRDALRFGKSLSWSPIDIVEGSAAPTLAAAVPPPPATPSTAKSGRQPESAQKPTPAQDVLAMPTGQNRLRSSDDRVSVYIKTLMAVMTAVIIVAIAVMVGEYVSLFGAPAPIPVPNLVGKQIADARAIAKENRFQLREHEDYNERPRGEVYRTEPSRGDEMRPNRAMNVWVSRGPIYVDVPNLAGMSRDDAEQKLKDAGLTVGKVIPEYSAKIALNSVVRQDVSPRKRVLHDQPVGFTISDGPKPDFATNDSSLAPDPSVPEPTHTFNRPLKVEPDHRGMRRVKVEFEDSDHIPQVVINNEEHNEGDRFPVSFEYRGKQITLRVYYDEKLVTSLTFDPEATRNKLVK